MSERLGPLVALVTDSDLQRLRVVLDRDLSRIVATERDKLNGWTTDSLRLGVLIHLTLDALDDDLIEIGQTMELTSSAGVTTVLRDARLNLPTAVDTWISEEWAR